MDLDHNKSLKSQTKNEVIDTGIALKDDPEYTKVSCSYVLITFVVREKDDGSTVCRSVLQNAPDGNSYGSSEERSAAR